MTNKFYTSRSSIPENAPVGGKAKGLGRLIELGFNVPHYVVIPWASKRDYKSVIQQLLDEAVLDKNVKYAVRSSANIEDGNKKSFAGIFDSKLNVATEDLPNAVSSVFEAVKNERSSVYHTNDENDDPIEMAVIVQEMIDADQSGIGFSVDPVTFEHKFVISATQGLGDQLVSGETSGDHYAVKLDFIEKQKGDHVDTSKEEFILNEDMIFAVAEAIETLSESLDQQVDIEFCFKNNTLYLLQVRPITTLPDGVYTVYDNSNIVESYPGITTPLTFSFINMVYTRVYKQFTNLMGVKEKEIEERSDIFENTLALVRGRVYYNLLNWYKMLAMAPGFSINARYMETMMGVKERFNLKENCQLNKHIARFRVVLMTLNIIRIHLGLKKRTKAFIKKLDQVIGETKNKKLEEYSFTKLQQSFISFEHTLILQWKAPLINDFFSMIWFGLLKKQCASYFPDRPNLHNDLLCGSHDIISTQPMIDSLKIVEALRKNEVWHERFQQKAAHELFELIGEHKTESIPSAILTYIEKFGDRCIGELKLESISYKDQPVLFVELLQSYLNEGLDLSVVKNKGNASIRDEAEAFVRKSLKGKPVRRILFNRVLKNARWLVSNRENLRYERTRVFGLVREFFTKMGKQLEHQAVIDHHRDIFYLEHDEVLSINVDAIDKNWKSIIAERKKTFESYSDQKPPNDRFFTYNDNFSDHYIYQDTLDTFDGELQGIGCSPGIVEAEVCRVDDPTTMNSVNGNIMIARSTDPGWVKLFPSAKAIVVEKGSLLSHTSIVAREMGIPCIVGVDHLLVTLNDGDVIKMDGSKGSIEIIKKKDE